MCSGDVMCNDDVMMLCTLKWAEVWQVSHGLFYIVPMPEEETQSLQENVNFV